MPRLRRRPRKNEIQTLIFPRSRFTPTTARAWAKEHGFRARNDEMDIRKRTIYVRQYNPEDFDRLRSIRLGDGVRAVYGILDRR